MDLRIFWTDTARFQLEDIFNYYKNKASLIVAQKIVKQIVDRSLYLQKHPGSGQVEELLKQRNNEYRYLIEGNYKIIYWIEKNSVTIASVFDCRQNPVKLKKL